MMDRRGMSGLAIFLELSLLYGFKVMLDFIFVRYALPAYFYEPYYSFYGEFELDRLIPGYILLPLIWFWVRPVLKNPRFPVSRLLIAVQLLTLVIPSFTVYSQAYRPATHLLEILTGFALLVFTVRVMPDLSIPIPSRRISLGLFALGIAIVVYVYAGLVFSGGLNRLNFNLLEVYSFREEYVENSFPLSGYLVPWVGYVLNITMLIHLLLHRKIFGIGLVLILQAILFGMTSFKAFLFLPLFTLGYGWASPRIAFSHLALLGGAVLLSFLWVTTLLGQPLGLGIADRIFYAPVTLHSLYFDYFSANPHAYMSGSPWLSYLPIQTPYSMTSVELIAQEYWGRDFSPNVGWIGSAYADFGTVGVVITAIVLGLFMRAGDTIARKIPTKGIPEGLFLGYALTMTNSSFSTALITHGGLVALMSLWTLSGFISRQRVHHSLLEKKSVSNR
jgi:hypothetical protein